MQKRIVNKVRSRTGASITFALLLFLVCAVIGSAVLTAGTAAAGRMSRAAEMDQRYYSVNSAARLLIDQIESEGPVTIVKTVETVNGTAGTPVYKDKTGVTIGNTYNFTSITGEAAYYYIQNYTAETPTVRKDSVSYQITLAADGDALTAEEKGILAVNIREEITLPDGTMLLTLTPGDGSEANTYKIKLTFNLDMTAYTEHTEEPDTTPGATGTIEVDATTYKISWHIQDVDVVGTGRIKEA